MAHAATNLILGEVFQTAYVTTDTNRALEILKRRYGVGEFLRSGTRTIPLVAGGEMTLELSFAWVGATMIELIEPVAGAIGIYRDYLPSEGFGTRFHHVGVRLHSEEQWRAMLEEVESRRHRIMLEVRTPSTRALYIDTREELGHYVEYLYYMDVPNSSLPRIPQNVPGYRAV
jgi:hypothetical protein